GVSPQALALADCVAIAAVEIGTIVVEDLEFPLPRGEPWIGHMVGIELALDPAHHADPGDAVGFTWARAVREAIQRMEGGITRGQARAGSLHGEQRSGGNQE